MLISSRLTLRGRSFLFCAVWEASDLQQLCLEYHAERTQAAGISGPAFLDMLRAMGYSKIQNLDCPGAGLAAIEQGQKL